MTPRIEPERVGTADDNLAPTDEALAAIVAALEQCLPAPGAQAPAGGAPGWRVRSSYPWRFSGRWWSAPAVLRRERPFR
ncbi:MAG: hypothetical protein JWO62_1712 [Acidimicrobiaceae bacterium]|nr:hypothetical protein [Acidimicrobiaceae bacterium]